jgi:CHAT domain-containing protein
VILVPHGPLHFLPFGALWNPARGHFVAQDHVLTLAPSASVLRFVRDKRKESSSGLLALGDPDGSLPHAEQEVRAIATLFSSTPLVGREATKSRLYREGASAGIVHLAAHAILDPVRPLFSHIDLAADGGLSPQDERADGQLRVYEIYNLDLQKANLVVLSACNTALGQRDEGDDLVGHELDSLAGARPSERHPVSRELSCPAPRPGQIRGRDRSHHREPALGPMSSLPPRA